MTAHARLSPSAAHRWAHCTASVKAIERAVSAGVIPKDSSSDAADEGTAAHQVRQDCLEWDMDPHDWIGSSIPVNGKRWPVTEDMAEYLMPGIDWIRERAGDAMLIETKVALDPWLPGQFGTIDCAFVMRSSTAVYLVLSDLKYGFSPVSPEENEQQMIYLLGVTRMLFGDDPAHWLDEFVIVIDQPRKGGLKDWTVSKADLLKFGEWIKERGVEALGEGVYRPSESACHWCPLAGKPGRCAAYDAWALAPLPIDLTDLDLEDLDTPPVLPKPFDLTPELKGWLLRHTPVITGWLKALYVDAYGDAMHGNPPPGHKLVLGDEGDRTWDDEAAAAARLVPALGDAAYAPRKIISFPQAEKLAKPGRKKPGHPELWEQIKDSFTRSPARPVLVTDKDKRPEHRPTAALAADLSDLD